MRSMQEDYRVHVMCVRCWQSRNRGFEVAKNQPAQPIQFREILPCCWCGGSTLVAFPGGGQGSQGFQVKEHIAKVPCGGVGGVHVYQATI